MKRVIRDEVYQKYNCKCAYCGEDLEYKDMQVDHIIPKLHFELKIADGDMDSIDNLNPSCRACNFYKGAHSMDTFRKYMITLHERIMKPFISRLGEKHGMIKVTPFCGKFYFERLLDQK